MITFGEYRELLANLAAQGHVSRSISSLGETYAQGLFLKHDVECRIERAVEIAQIEKDCGHIATFYFQADFLDSEAGRVGMNRIAQLGHEVAYHYDVLDENDGDFARSKDQFNEYMAAFSQNGHVVKTVCPHGNPTKIRNGWRSNKDFFRNKDIQKSFPQLLDVVVEFQTRFPKGVYISDAGYALRIIQDISGNDQSNQSAMDDGEKLDWSSIANQLEKNSSVVLSLHPHRFEPSRTAALTRKLIFRILKQGYGLLRRIPGVSIILNRFYTLARRV